MTSPFNEERNEHEFMCSGDKVTRDGGTMSRTHNALISAPCTIEGLYCTAVLCARAGVKRGRRTSAAEGR